MEDAEGIRAVWSTIPTALDRTGDLVVVERFRFTSFDTRRVFLDEECLLSLAVVN